jgi:hypothetical protein
MLSLRGPLTRSVAMGPAVRPGPLQHAYPMRGGRGMLGSGRLAEGEVVLRTYLAIADRVVTVSEEELALAMPRLAELENSVLETALLWFIWGVNNAKFRI